MLLKTLLIVVAVSLGGCATREVCVGSQFVRVEYGRPHQVLDRLGWIMGIPNKVVLWNRNIDNHQVSAETVVAAEKYLDFNGLDDVKLRVNQYDPAGEWDRLRQNQRVGAGWRYSLGLLHLAGYTLWPGRVFGGDKYNPYTNSIYVYSDIPEMPLAEAGYAKDIHARSYPGVYAAINDLPLANMLHESIATKDVLEYVEETGTRAEQISAKHLLCARYGLRAGHSVGFFFGTTVALPLELGGAAIGHLTGHLAAAAEREETDKTEAANAKSVNSKSHADSRVLTEVSRKHRRPIQNESPSSDPRPSSPAGLEEAVILK
jgi:hypothetical protein